MAYSVEYKKEILEQMKTKTIKQISEETGISQPTLYNWKKKILVEEDEKVTIRRDDNKNDELQLIKKYIKEKNIEEIQKIENIIDKIKMYQQIQAQLAKMYVENKDKKALKELSNKCPDNKDVQAQLAKMYVESKDKKALKELSDKCPDNQEVQIQLAILYVESKDKKALEELSDKCPDNKHVQAQLAKMYVENKDKKALEELSDKCPDNQYVQAQLAKMYVENKDKKALEELSDKCPDNQQIQVQLAKMYTNEKSKNDANISLKVGTRIRLDIFSVEDLEEFKLSFENKDSKEYNLLLIAMYQKLGQKKNALQLLKQVKAQGDYSKGLNVIEESLKAKKVIVYPYKTWDELIGWNVSQQDIQKEMEAEKERIRQEEIKKSEEQKNKENEKVKKQVEQIPDNNRTIENLNNEKVILPKQERMVQTVTKKAITPKMKTKTKQKTKKEEKTVCIKDKLSNKVQDIIEEISKKYYIKMQQVNINQGKYIKKYDKLQSILECDKNNKRAELELMLALINEGYRDVVKEEFPKEDYEFIDEIIKQYYAKSIKPQDAKKKMDEYCI